MGLEPLGTSPSDVADDYRSVAEVLGFTSGQPVRFVEGEIQVTVAAIQYRTGKVRPDSALDGIKINASDSRTFGPNSPWRLDQVWVREDVAGAGAKVAAAGWVETMEA